MSFSPEAQFSMQLIQGLSEQIGQGRRKVQENQVLGQILPQIQQEQDPEALLNLILQTQLQSGLQPETQQRLAALAGPISQISRSREQSELKQAEIERKKQELSEKQQREFQEKAAPIQAAFERVQRMRDILNKKSLGRGSGVQAFFGGEVARDKAEYEQLGKSLIQFATNIPIRNRLEFESLAGQLMDSTQPLDFLEGTLNAMERIIQDSLTSFLPDSKQDKLNIQTSAGPRQITKEMIQQERQRRKKK